MVTEHSTHREEQKTVAARVVANVSAECDGVLTGDVADQKYLEYLLGGGDVYELWKAIEAASSPETVKIIFLDFVRALIASYPKK